MGSMNRSDADCVVALSFGRASSESMRDPNRDIGRLASRFGLPVIAQRETASYCRQPFAIVGANRYYTDTWTALSEAKLLMDGSGFSKAVLVAHGAHITRAQRQAVKLKLLCSVPKSLPRIWDKRSLQWWTRSPWLWRVHELYTVPYVKLTRRM